MIASFPYPATGSPLNPPQFNPVNRPSEIQDQRILEAQNGNLQAFNELVLRHQDYAFRQAMWILNDEDAAEDATQEAFLHAFRKIQTFSGRSFQAWILRIVTNVCIDQLRRNKRRPCDPFCELSMNENDAENEPYWSRDPAVSPERAVEQNETGEAIMRAVQQLPVYYRLPVILVDIHELDYSEAAAVLHLSLGTLKSRLARARVKLREALGFL